jgi:hypothetical protein
MVGHRGGCCLTENYIGLAEKIKSQLVPNTFFDAACHPLHATSQLKEFRRYRAQAWGGQPPLSAEYIFKQLDSPSFYGKVVSDMSVWDAFFPLKRSMQAMLRFDPRGRPIVEIQPESPMEATAITIFVDRLFTNRATGVCKECKRTFVKRTRNQMFCPAPPGKGTSHQSLWKTKFTRAKIRFLKEASEETPGNWSRIVRIAEQRLRKEYSKEKDKELLTITVEWAKKQLERK